MTEKVRSFRDLKVWQRAMDLVPEVYRLASALPPDQKFGLNDQIRRAAVSIPANIAEGHGRQHRKEFLQHLSIARGSLAELLTLLLLAQRLHYLSDGDLANVEKMVIDVRMLLFGLINRLQPKT